MIIVKLQKSTRKNKKWNVVFDYQDKTYNIHFGAKNHDDFLITGNETKKQNYIKRHQVNEKWDDITTAGYWSKQLLWNKRTLYESMKDIESKNDVKIRLSLS